MSLLDLVLRCDEHDLHRVLWTDDVLDELVEVWVRNGARSEASARAIVGQIRAAFEDQQVVRTDYEQLIAEMPGQDEDDHVHAAAAIAAAPSTLLTVNTKDFPAAELGARGVTVRHPDDYFLELFEAEPVVIHGVLAGMSRDRHHPPMTVADVVGALQRAGLSSSPARSERAEGDVEGRDDTGRYDPARTAGLCRRLSGW
jgi:hypothetical protein